MLGKQRCCSFSSSPATSPPNLPRTAEIWDAGTAPRREPCRKRLGRTSLRARFCSPLQGNALPRLGLELLSVADQSADLAGDSQYSCFLSLYSNGFFFLINLVLQHITAFNQTVVTQAIDELLLEKSPEGGSSSHVLYQGALRHPDADFIHLFPSRSRRAHRRAFKSPAFCQTPLNDPEMCPGGRCPAQPGQPGLAPGEIPRGRVGNSRTMVLVQFGGSVCVCVSQF